MRKFRLLPVVALLWLAAAAGAADARREIHFPDLPGYQTLKCDLHTHSVFSDGEVWPTVRVAEAWRLGLDAVALSDHIEYQPHRADVPTQHNRPYDLAAGPARQANLLLPRAAEITRDTPPGHFNAIFITDAAGIAAEDFVETVRRANEQGGFVFWNHQGWKGAEAGRWLDVHTTLYENKWLHGMEVCNGNDYYPDAHRWCLEKGLTMLGNSDIHAPDLREQTTPQDHRTMTLVFVKERSLDGLKEALMAGRTAVWFNDQVIGRREWLEPLFAASVHVARSHARSGNNVLVTIRNDGDVDLRLRRTGAVGPADVRLPAGTTSLVSFAVGRQSEAVELPYTATNFLIAPGEGLPVTLTIAPP